MNAQTCAACDCEMEDPTVKVTIGGQTVEVCCEDCAIALREAAAAQVQPATSPQLNA